MKKNNNKEIMSLTLRAVKAKTKDEFDRFMAEAAKLIEQDEKAKN